MLLLILIKLLFTNLKNNATTFRQKCQMVFLHLPLPHSKSSPIQHSLEKICQSPWKPSWWTGRHSFSVHGQWGPGDNVRSRKQKTLCRFPAHLAAGQGASPPPVSVEMSHLMECRACLGNSRLGLRAYRPWL